MYAILNQESSKPIYLNSYSRNVNFNNDINDPHGDTSYAYMDIASKTDPASVTNINSFVKEPITDIELFSNNDVSIYTLSSIEGKFTSLNESISDDYQSITVNLEIKI